MALREKLKQQRAHMDDLEKHMYVLHLEGLMDAGRLQIS